MTDRKLMQQALEALELEATRTPIPETAAAMAALRARLAEPEPEPVAWMGTSGVGEKIVSKSQLYSFMTTPLYTAPPTRRPLTDEEIDELPWCPSFENPMRFTTAQFVRNFTRAIERKITGGNDE